MNGIVILVTGTVSFQKFESVDEIEKAQRDALSVIPEFCVKDMAQWFSFLAFNVLRIHPNITNGMSVSGNWYDY